MLEAAITSLIRRNPGVDLNRIEALIAGATNQAGEDSRNVARMAVLLAGLPVSVAGITVNSLCTSGLQSIMDAARSIQCGDGDIYLAAGVESMTRAPFIIAKPETAWARKTEMVDSTIGWRFTNPVLAKKYYPFSMGETAEHIATQWAISREEQDLFALASQEKYQLALKKGLWKEEILSMGIKEKNHTVSMHQDEHPRITSMEKLAALPPAFLANGTVTAGNSSGINDGAAAVLMAGETAIQEFGLLPKARIVSMAITGVEPSIMGIGPVPATRKALQRAGLNIQDIGLVELNEAFAVQALACIRELNLDPAIVNVNGGSIAIGHPLGCTGVRISVTLLYQMQRQKVRYGLATMCAGVGLGAAIIYERI